MASRHKKQLNQPVSVIVTVLNEAHTIEALIATLAEQTLQPDRVVIIDGGSTDGTLEKIQNYPKKVEFELVSALVPGNRSMGRNAAIQYFVATQLVAITDAGCMLDSAWLENLVQTWTTTNAPVIAGYYATLPTVSSFQRAASPFFLVMPDKVDEKNFLPATRSMLLEKSVWETVGGFDEQLSDNEDYAFANLVKSSGVPMGFARHAIAYWSPPETLQRFWRTIFRFARGDVAAGLYRPKVVLVFLRYFLSMGVVAWYWQQNPVGATVLAVGMLLLYSVWSVGKLGKYVTKGDLMHLPLLQITADLAVMCGSISGLLRKLERLLPSQEY